MGDAFLKYLLILIAIIYFIFPYDLLPDIFGLLGRLDDFLVIAYALYIYYQRKKKPLEEAAKKHRQNSESSGSSEDSASSEFDPYEVLGVANSATKDEITAAYRQQAAKYHPDKVQHLGAELREVAHKKMLEIQRAYEMLS